MIVIDRYDPRVDRDALKEIFEDFIKNKCYFFSHWQKFEQEFDAEKLIQEFEQYGLDRLRAGEHKTIGLG